MFFVKMGGHRARQKALCAAVCAAAVFAIGSVGRGAQAADAGIKPVDLACEYKKAPLAIEASHPRLFWKVAGKGRAQKQTAYQILAASTPALLKQNTGDLWDSGEVASSETAQIPYAGKPLDSFTHVFWKVRVWDEKGAVSGWSKPQTWAMGLLKPKDWSAQWIGYPMPPADTTIGLMGASWIWHAPDGTNPPKGTRYFRASLNLPADVVNPNVALYVTADDEFSVFVNDGAEHKGPRGTDVWKKFQTVSLTKELHPGANTLLIAATNTLEGPAGLIARVVIKGDNKIYTALVSDGAWESATDKAGPFAPARVVGGYGVEPWGSNVVSANGDNRTPPPYFRKAFTLTKPVKRATLYATALGVYELSLNGKPASDDVLSPGWTDFRKRAHYLAYDVSKQVHPGSNVLGAILGDGWYASYLAFTGKHHYYGGNPKLRLQLRVEYADGETETVGTDETWKTAYGPVKYADLLMGCTTDTRQELTGWNTPKFDDAAWTAVDTTPNAPDIAIVSQPNEPIRATATLAAKARTEPTPGVFLYNIGQNMVGWARIKVSGKPGQVVTVRFGERLNPDGTLYTTNLRSARATDTFTLAGGKQTLEPKFTFHGFQYVEVSGLENAPSPKAVVGVVASSDLAPALAFNSDSALLNRLVSNIDWGFRGNSLDVPTDCPQRDERAGWTGDAQVFAKTAMFHRNAAPFFTKWLQDMEDGQFADGSYPDVAPSILGGGNAAWEDAGVICTYRLYEMYADTNVIEAQWASMTRFMEHLAKKSPNGIRSAGAYGDWLLLAGPQQSAIHGTAYYFRSASLMATMADAIGKQDEAQAYRALADKIRTAFQAQFVSPDGMVADKGAESQTFYALALEWDLLPTEKRSFAARRLREMLGEQGNHLATGFIGTPVLLQALAGSGYAGEANTLLLSETYPSWLYQVKIGATTMWERWDGWTPEKGFQNPGMNSFNHYWLGCVGEWIYSGLVGIDTVQPGWKTVVLRPRIASTMTRALVKYEAQTGRIECGWEKQANGTLEMTFSIPANVSATVYVPTGDATKVMENDRPVVSGEGVSFVRQEKESAVFTVGSGKYKWIVRQ